MAVDPPPIPKPDPPPETDLRQRSFEEEYGRPSSPVRDAMAEVIEEEVELHGPDLLFGAARRSYGCFSGLVLGFLIGCVGVLVVVLAGEDVSLFKVLAVCTLFGGVYGLASPESTSFFRITRQFFDF